MNKIETVIYWNNVVKKLREEARKSKEQETKRLRLLQETIDFVNECNRNLDNIEKIFLVESEN